MSGRRIGLLLLVACLCCLPFWWFGLAMARHDVWSIQGQTMGTRYSITAVAEWGNPRPEPVQSMVDARLAEINRRMSTYDPASELSLFNASTSTDWVEVSSDTAQVVAFAIEVAEQTAGAFDPTVGPVVNLWGFGPGKRRTEPPTESEVASALQRVGFTKVQVRLDPPAIRKSQPDLYLDLSAVAKGYAVDVVSQLLQSQGAASSMVEIGGEVVCHGNKPDGSPWRIGIERPDATGRTLQTAIAMVDESLATSGDYRNFFEVAGHRFSHTIHPSTGRPVDHTLATVSVRAKTCMQADAYATAILVLGPVDGYNWAVQQNLAALLVERTNEGFSAKQTPAWVSPLQRN